MARQFAWRHGHDLRAKAYGLGLSLILVVAMVGCTPDSDTGTPPPDPDPNDPQFVQQGINEVVELYQTAWRQADIDRLQPLLRMADAPATSTTLRQVDQIAFQPSGCPKRAALSANQFRDAISSLLRRFRVLSHRTQILNIDASSSEPIVTLRETVSLEDMSSSASTQPAQRTCVSTLTLRLTRQSTPSMQDLPGVIVTSFLITEVVREGPIFRVEMPGRAQSGALARMEVSEVTDIFLAQQVVLEADGRESFLQLQEDGSFRGVAMLADDVPPGSLQVTIRGATGEDVVFRHTYQTRMPQDFAVHRVFDSADIEFRTLAEGADGTIWAGAVGDEMNIDERGIYEIEPQDAVVARSFRPFIRDDNGIQILSIVDLVFDESDRLHVVFLLRGERGIRANGVLVINQLKDLLEPCQTANITDADYPFRFVNAESGEEVPSASIRAIAAGGDDIWLYASDGGVARVIDRLHSRTCGDQPVYTSIFRRQRGTEGNRLLTNTVPALSVREHGTLWFGTALGLMLWQDDLFTSIPFDPLLSITPGQFSQGQLNTLESFIGSVSEAIFAAQPIETVMIDDLSFLDFFDRALVKEDFIFSMVEDRQNRLWVGTIGGGIRRVEAIDGTLQDTLHITREAVSGVDSATQTRITVDSQGQLVSHIIFALAIAPNGDVWAATNKGASRIQEQADGTVLMTNYTALDSLTLPVRDVLVSDAGIVWLATDGGVYKLTSASAQLRGTVMSVDRQSGLESPVEGADVILQDTLFRAITDAEGGFSLSPLPLSTDYTVHIQSESAIDGPFTQTFGAVTLEAPTEISKRFMVVRREPPITIDPLQGGSYTFPAIPGSEIILGPEGSDFPSQIGLTSLPVDSLPPPLEGITLITAAELQPNAIEFTQPITLTLPNLTPLPSGTPMFLVCLETSATGLRYRRLGRGNVDEDGLTSTVRSASALTSGCPILGIQTFSSFLP